MATATHAREAPEDTVVGALERLASGQRHLAEIYDRQAGESAFEPQALALREAARIARTRADHFSRQADHFRAPRLVKTVRLAQQ